MLRMFAMCILLLGIGIVFFRCGEPFPEEDPLDAHYLTRQGFHGLKIGREVTIAMDNTRPQVEACVLRGAGEEESLRRRSL